MGYAFKCDRCKEFRDDIPFKAKHRNKEYEICESCSKKLDLFMKGVELDEPATEDGTDSAPVDETKAVDYEIEYLVYESTNPHDCETIYSCPYCKKKISSWTLFYQKRESKESDGTYRPYCPECGKFVLERKW